MTYGGSAERTGTTRDEILATALGLFRANGYTATSLRQIAEHLGLTKAAVYYHFHAKEELAVGVSRPFLDSLEALVIAAQGEADDPAAGRRRDILAGYIDLFIQHHEVVHFLSQDPAALRHPDVGERARSLVAALQEALAGRGATAHDRISAACALGAVHAVAVLPTEQVQAARGAVFDAAAAALEVSARGGAAFT